MTSWLDEAKNAEDFLKCHATSVPTTCCYQFLCDDEIDIIQFFCLPGLGICCQIKSYWAHSFMAACFAQLTLTLLIIYHGKYMWENSKGLLYLHGVKGEHN